MFLGVRSWSKKYRVTVLGNNWEELEMLKTEPSRPPIFNKGAKRREELKFPHSLNLFTDDNPDAYTTGNRA